LKNKGTFQEKLWKEIKILILFAGIGLFLIIFNPDLGSWKYPMGFTQDVREVLRIIGYGFLIAAYPVFLLIRLTVVLLKRIFH
jgi:uncharacterized membrane protein YoaT (DUF817 family)